jgi:hypothetical protein
MSCLVNQLRIEKKDVMPYFIEQPWCLRDTVVINSHHIPKKLTEDLYILYDSHSQQQLCP